MKNYYCVGFRYSGADRLAWAKVTKVLDMLGIEHLHGYTGSHGLLYRFVKSNMEKEELGEAIQDELSGGMEVESVIRKREDTKIFCGGAFLTLGEGMRTAGPYRACDTQ